ncbi:MAG: PKD domain-containing protein, partial [Chthoniobacterales bacterium]
MEILFSVRANKSRITPSNGMMMSIRVVMCILLLLVLVQGVHAAANFIANPVSGSVPLNVQFTDASTGSPTGWVWFFGDETYNAQWTQMTPSAPWDKRAYHNCVVTPDGSIILMGGWG